MTNTERVKDTIRSNQKYGIQFLSEELTVENAVTLAAIADALEELTEHIRWQRDAVESIDRKTEGGMTDIQEW